VSSAGGERGAHAADASAFAEPGVQAGVSVGEPGGADAFAPGMRRGVVARRAVYRAAVPGRLAPLVVLGV